jgi:hypothetical protein
MYDMLLTKEVQDDPERDHVRDRDEFPSEKLCKETIVWV